jgi:FKBP-type peptidyl-prolyl cis-trans isomerase
MLNINQQSVSLKYVNIKLNKCFNSFIYGLLAFICTLIFSCGSDSQTKQFAEKQSHLSDKLVEVNRSYVKIEAAAIDSFIQQHQYQMSTSKSGLRYKISSTGKGLKADVGDAVELKYKMYLLDGTLCYDSDSVGTMKFNVEKSDALKGIHEVVQMMHKGDDAQIILPAHLAYGLTGDQNKVPYESALYCTIQLIELVKK